MTFNFKSFIVSTLRRASYRWPARSDALKAAKVAYGKYKCAQCNNIYARKDVSIDHKEPVIGVEGFQTWDIYISRMFCEASNFQILCSDCHDAKSLAEKEQRKLWKKENKGE